MTTAFSPTSTSINVVSGPIRAPAATEVAPSSDVPGSKTTSGARSTEACTQVVEGSTTETPSRIQCCRIRRFTSAFIRESWIRSLIPSVCQRSSINNAPTGSPAWRTTASTSVRYSSP